MNIRIFVTRLYGLAIIASGLMRYLQQPDGEKGLWFGVVFGALALFATLCLTLQKHKTASVILWTTILVVGGWFVYEALIKKGFANSELRQLVIIGLTVAVAVFNLLPSTTLPAVTDKQVPGTDEDG